MAARNYGVRVRRTMMPETMLAAMLPRVETTISTDVVRNPVEDPRRNSVDDHLPEADALVVPRAVIMSFTGEHRLYAECK